MGLLTKLNDYYAVSKELYFQKAFKNIKEFNHSVIVRMNNKRYAVFFFNKWDETRNNFGYEISVEEMEKLLSGELTSEQLYENKMQNQDIVTYSLSNQGVCDILNENSSVKYKQKRNPSYKGDVDLALEKELIDTYVKRKNLFGRGR